VPYHTPWHERPFAPAAGSVLCRLEDIPDGEGRGFEFGQGARVFRMFVVRRGGEAWGYLNVCPHFQLPVNVREHEFVNTGKTRIMCMNHCALFRFEDGHCVDGPCEGDRLNPVPIAVVAGDVRVGARPPA
jgi:nitrite reductase/ring-hydroxylating ferredoxin subunit